VQEWAFCWAPQPMKMNALFDYSMEGKGLDVGVFIAGEALALGLVVLCYGCRHFWGTDCQPKNFVGANCTRYPCTCGCMVCTLKQVGCAG